MVKITNNGMQKPHRKPKIEQHEFHFKPGDSGAPEGVTGPDGSIMFFPLSFIKLVPNIKRGK